MWISLFAMLMVFVGPLLSQSIAMPPMPGMDMPMPMHHGMQHAARADSPKTGIAHADAHHDAQASTTPAPAADLHPLWEKCGYCDFMLHCPALPQTLALLGSQASPEPRALHYFVRAGHARQPRFPGALTRAPPTRLLA